MIAAGCRPWTSATPPQRRTGSVRRYAPLFRAARVGGELTTIPVLELPDDPAAHARGVATDPDNPIFATYGDNAWKSRRRAHPDVAARHPGDMLAGD